MVREGHGRTGGKVTGMAEIRAETETMGEWGGQLGKGGAWAQC